MRLGGNRRWVPLGEEIDWSAFSLFNSSYFLRVSRGDGIYGYRLKCWLFLRLSVNFFQSRLTIKLKVNFFVSKI